MFTEKDLQQIQENGLTIEKVNAQIDLIKTGMSYSNLIAAATIGEGILKLSEQEEQEFINHYEAKRDTINIVKFVPASGAATRMFKFLFQFINTYNVNEESLDAYLKKHNNKDIKVFVDGLKKSPFYEVVINKVQQFVPNYDALSDDEKLVEFVKTIIDKNRLDLSANPKGLLPFHQYKNGVYTPFKEHLFEAAFYASSNQKANLHFTISDAHTDKFKNELNTIQLDVEAEVSIKFNVSFSYQNKSTDTIAITSKDELYRDENGKLLFRPSGHGALMENLNTLDNDIVFIKNIDNIVVSNISNKVSRYKKMMAGILLETQEQAFNYLHQIDNGNLNENDLNEIAQFLSNRMNVVIADAFQNNSKENQIEYLKEKLDRPIRVCGMVKNEGEPGGGPFYVKDENGNTSLQIIEFAQIDIDNKNQAEITTNATHFNPTDLVCGIKNYKGEAFNLEEYVDHKAAFITLKSQNGTVIKALELPGLWNGSMADWNSIFVEIPLITFNPVKTVNDLLKPAHQVE
jgi:hypothetical protein